MDAAGAEAPVWVLLLLLSTLLGGALTSVLLPLAVIRRKRTLARLMGLSGPTKPPSAVPPARSSPPAPPPTVTASARREPCEAAVDAVQWMRRRANRVSLVYALALLPPVTALAALWLLLDPGFDGVTPARWAALTVGWGAYAAVMLLSLGHWSKAGRAAILVGTGLVVWLTGAVLGTDLTPLVAMTVLPTGALGWLVARRSVRAVGPAILLALMLGLGVALGALQIGFEVLERSLDVEGLQTLQLLGVLGLAGGFVLGAGVMVVLSRAYAAHRLGDDELKAAAWALIFFIVLAMTVAPGVGHAAGLFLLCWVAYWGLVRLGLARFSPPHPERPPRLLFLRAFRSGRGARRALASAEGLWRTWGPVDVIAAPDVAADTFEVHELEALVRGSTRKLFEATSGGARDPGQPDVTEPGGRYRVEERFCSGDAWRGVVRELAPRSSAVLFDIRGLTDENAGVRWEVELILDTVPLHRVVWIVDAAETSGRLADIVRSHWPRLADDSPNRERAEALEILGEHALVGRRILLSLAAAARCHDGADGTSPAAPASSRTETIP